MNKSFVVGAVCALALVWTGIAKADHTATREPVSSTRLVWSCTERPLEAGTIGSTVVICQWVSVPVVTASH
jgi:uncharacterized membrane protein YdcZ (DUF606 family)